jgi:hypothetical protein
MWMPDAGSNYLIRATGSVAKNEPIDIAEIVVRRGDDLLTYIEAIEHFKCLRVLAAETDLAPGSVIA